MVRSGYYTGGPRPVSAPPQPQPHPQQLPPSVSFQAQPRQHFPRNFIPMMPPGYTNQRHMGGNGGMGGMGAMRRR